MSNLVKVKELEQLTESRAIEIKKSFDPIAVELSNFEHRFVEILESSKDTIDKELTQKAKRLRLDISKIRVATGKIKDKQKEFIKLEDKAIMGVHNFIVLAVKEKENKLKEIEDHFEILEKKRLDELQAKRVEMLSVYVEDAHDRDLTKFEEDEFESLLLMKKKAYDDRLEAERIAKEERERKKKEEAEERERIRKENEKLKKEAEEREKLAKIEAKRLALEESKRIAKENEERKKREEKQRKEREAYETKLRLEREEREKVERTERLKRENLESELKAKEDAERKAKEDEEARIQAELNKGDAEKVKDLIVDLNVIKSKYTFESDKNKKMFSDVTLLIDKVINHISIYKNQIK